MNDSTDIIPRPDPIPDECGCEPSELKRILDLDDRPSIRCDIGGRSNPLATAMLLLALVILAGAFAAVIIHCFPWNH
jgi:hypothetical protein